MTNEKPIQANEKKTASFGSRLKAAREAKGMERREVAAQLRLAEKKIAMMEYERYPADLPVTFIRGYLRAYGRFLQLPEHEIQHAVNLIKPKPELHPKTLPTTALLLEPPTTNSHYFMHFFTLLIILTMLGLVGTWWYTHNTPTQLRLALPEISNSAPTASVANTIEDENQQKIP